MQPGTWWVVVVTFLLDVCTWVVVVIVLLGVCSGNPALCNLLHIYKADLLVGGRSDAQEDVGTDNPP